MWANAQRDGRPAEYTGRDHSILHYVTITNWCLLSLSLCRSLCQDEVYSCIVPVGISIQGRLRGWMKKISRLATTRQRISWGEVVSVFLYLLQFPSYDVINDVIMSDADCTPGCEPRSVAASYILVGNHMWPTEYGASINDRVSPQLLKPKSCTSENIAHIIQNRKRA